jgi:hypothetical protein
MQRREFLQALAAAGLLLPSARALASTKLVVIAHPAVPVSRLEGADIETIFTTRKIYWPDGSRIIACNVPPRSPLRVEFDERALQLSPDEVARFWIDRRVRGGQPPPRQVPDLELMLRVVAKMQGAIGYAPAWALSSSVKRLADV